tara:strand:+ start:327 stop:941 length:615 start_codon:yes stop_codon:yes gene_type:complete
VAENYTIEHFTVTKVGEVRVITAKFSKAEIVGRQGDLEIVLDCPSWHVGKLEVGRKYKVKVQGNDNPSYNDSVQEVEENNTPEPSAPPQNKEEVVAMIEQGREQLEVAERHTQPKATNKVKPDVGRRNNEFQQHYRSAENQATVRVQMLLSAIKDKLIVTEDGYEVSTVRKSTVDNWLREYVDAYMEKAVNQEPKDSYGVIGDD